jgi:hypothetical protein
MFIPQTSIPTRSCRLDPARAGRGKVTGLVRLGPDGFEIQPGPGPRWWLLPASEGLTRQLKALLGKTERWATLHHEWKERLIPKSGQMVLVGAHEWRVERATPSKAQNSRR